MTPPESKTHRIAILRQDNGELQEDVVPRAAVEPSSTDDGPAGGISWYGDPDSDGEDSFPASDPPSHWAGSEDDDIDGGARSATARIVDTMPVGEVEARPHPAAPIPGRLTRRGRPPHPQLTRPPAGSRIFGNGQPTESRAPLWTVTYTISTTTSVGSWTG